MQKEQKSNKNIYITVLFLITVFVTNISQVPDLIGNSGMRLLTYGIWILMALVVIVASGKDVAMRISDVYKIMTMAVIIILQCLVMEIFGYNALGVYLLRPLLLSLFVFQICYNLAHFWTPDQFKLITYAYIISGLVVASFVYIAIFATEFDWSSRLYAYESKNSVSQILLTVVVLLLIFRKRVQIPGMTVLMDIGTVFLTVTLLMLKSRATLLGLALVFLSVLFSKHYHHRTRMLCKLIVAIFFLIFVFSAEFRDFLIYDVMFAGREEFGLDGISSGRITMISEFPDLFFEKPFFGQGQAYIEIMQLDALLELGLLGGVLINVLALIPIFYAWSSFRKNGTDYNFALLIIALFYYLNSFFEQVAPFGPGVKCYFLWALFGMALAWNKKESDKDEKGALDHQYAHHL